MLFLTLSIKYLSSLQQAVSPGLVESDILQENANDELISIMPTLAAKDVAAAVIYAISVKENVQVSKKENCCSSKRSKLIISL